MNVSNGVQRRWAGTLAVGAFSVLLSAAPAQAQRSLEKLVEPTRFALVIGNAKYADTGNLNDLGSPCSDNPKKQSDSKTVADALRSAHWEVEHVCNLKTDQLRARIKSFNRRVQLEYPAFGIIYFSGHGAQVAGTNYLFGVDANIVPSDEVKIYKQNPYAQLFLNSAISLDVEMRDVQPLWGKAVVVFVDACRANPILDELRNARILTFPAVASEPENVLYSFATQAGKAAPDGGLSSISRYARFLSDAIKGESPDIEEVDQLLSAVGTQVVIDSNHQQITARAGLLQRPPRFCIRGCGAPADYWKSLTEQFGTSSAPSNSSPAAALTQPEPSAVQHHGTTTSPRMIRASLQFEPAPAETPMPPVVQAPSVPAGAPAGIAPEPSRDAVPARTVRFDLLYCSGDSATEERERKSEAIRSQLLELKGNNSPVGGFETGEVRLVAVPPVINQSLYQASDTVLLFNRDSPAQRDWATRLQQSLRTPLRIQEKPGVASDYIRILVCDGVRTESAPARTDPTTPGLTVYMQASNSDQLLKASRIRADLVQRVPSARIAKDVEVVDASPIETEIRYFSRRDEQDAGLIARATGELLNKRVRARLIRGYEAKVQDNRLIEVWIGKRETP